MDLIDIDAEALRRTKEDIYPNRYGKWDTEINLYPVGREPNHSYDITFIGTPPDTHIAIAREQLATTRALVVEKPLCGPNLANLGDLIEEIRLHDVRAFVGYNHLCGKALHCLRQILQAENVSPVSIDVEFREHWGGIFAAHPWLAGPGDSYLGFSERGGGATGEHSHGISLWQHLALQTGQGRVTEVYANTRTVTKAGLDYDQISIANLKTESGLIGRLAQDVVTNPPQKNARIFSESGIIEVSLSERPGVESVSTKLSENSSYEVFEKNRPDDFIAELDHIEDVLMDQTNQKYDKSPLNFDRGLETMLVISAILKSARTGHPVSIDYSNLNSAL